MCLPHLVYGSNGKPWSKPYPITGNLLHHIVLQTFLISVPSIPSDNLPSVQETLPSSKKGPCGRKDILEQLPESKERSSTGEVLDKLSETKEVLKMETICDIQPIVLVSIETKDVIVFNKSNYFYYICVLFIY